MCEYGRKGVIKRGRQRETEGDREENQAQKGRGGDTETQSLEGRGDNEKAGRK